MAQALRPSFDAFVSYSHAVDGSFAPVLVRGLQRFAKPWYRARALRVFRDNASLSADPHLWSSIQQALDASQFFILLASTDAAASAWVAREVSRWRETSAMENVLIGLTDGEIVWDADAGDFDRSRTTALPATLYGAFPEEPRHVDLRWARDADELSLSHPAFREAVAELAAPLHGKAKDELASEEVRQHRRTVRIARGAAAALVTLTGLAIAAGIVAVMRGNAATRQLRLAESRQLAAQAVLDYGDQRLDQGLLLSLEADRLAPTAEARSSLVEGLETSANVFEFLHNPGDATSIAFSRDDRTLAIGNSHGLVTEWSVASGQRLAHSLRVPNDAIQALAYTPDGRTLTAATLTGSLVRWSIPAGKRTGSLLHTQAAALAFEGDGKTITAADTDGSVTRFSAATGHRSATLSGSGGSLNNAAALSPDASIVATAGQSLNLWDAMTGTRIGRPVRAAGGAGLWSVAFTPNGKTVAAGTFVGTVVRWLRATERPVGALLRAPFNPVLAVAFSPNGRMLAAGNSAGTVMLWDLSKTGFGDRLPAGRMPFRPAQSGAIRRDVTTRRWLKQLRGPYNRAVVVSPDGAKVAVGLNDGSVEVFNLTTKRVVETLQLRRTSSGSPYATSLAFSPDGKTLAAGSAFGSNAKGTVTLWDLQTGRPLGEPLDAGGPRVRAVAFNRDGTELAATTSAGDVIWTALPLGNDLSSTQTRICSVVHRSLTRAEWQEFLPGRTYHATCPNA